MNYEVELKFPLVGTNISPQTLLDLGAAPQAPIVQIDQYFGHPVRDFGETDEALRLRSTGGKNRITYKGSLLDAETKSREEIELAFTDGDQPLAQFSKMLETLGFQKVRQVKKTRTPYHFTWEARDIELAWDEVDGLGTFLEIETMSNPDDFDAAKNSILELANHLGLENSERRSYLGLLLEQDGV